ncbi:MAG: Solitary outer membrane autotransporter beta-barrel domain [Psychromonas sp.]
MNKGLFVFIAGLFTPSIIWALENISQIAFNEAFAVATVITDSNALTFGVANFDLDYFVETDGSEEALNLKKSLQVLVLPYTWKLNDLEDGWSQSVTVRAFHIQIARDNQFLQGVNNFEKEKMMGGYAQYQQQYAITKNWYGQAGLGLHLSYYINEFNYGNNFPEHIKDELNGSVFNTTALALIAEPHLNFGYKKSEDWGQWTLHNSNHYISGRGIAGEAENVEGIRPEGWRIGNGVELKFDVPNLFGVADFVAFDFVRIDIGGDISGLSDDGHYYETGISWVIDTNKKIPFLDNIGVGLKLNHGSSLSGGTLVFYYNE